MRTKRESGMALIVALLVVAAAALFAMTTTARSRRGAVDTVRDRATAIARAAAAGGVEHARWALARDADYTGETLFIGTSVVEIEVVRTSAEVVVFTRAWSGAMPYSDTVTERVEATARGDEVLPCTLPEVPSFRWRPVLRQRHADDALEP